MSDISALEGRITAALDRIRRGIDAQPVPEASPELRTALETERAANVELVARVQALKERQDTQIKTLTDSIEKQRTQFAALDVEMQNLRKANADLRATNEKLRIAVTEGADKELVEAAITAELTAIAAERSAESAEIDAILAQLKPLIEETPSAAG